MRRTASVAAIALVMAVCFAELPTFTVGGGYYDNSLYNMYVNEVYSEENHQKADDFYAEVAVDHDMFGVDLRFTSNRLVGYLDMGWYGDGFGVKAFCSTELFHSETVQYGDLEVGMLAEVCADFRHMSVRMYGKASCPFVYAYIEGNEFTFRDGTFAVAMGAELHLLKMIHVGAEIESYQHKCVTLSFDPTSISNRFFAELTVPMGVKWAWLAVRYEHLCQHPEIAWNNYDYVRFNRAYNIVTAGIEVRL